MPLDCAVPTRKTTVHRPGSRFSVPCGLIAGTLVAAALVWGPYAIIPGSSLLSGQVQTGIYLGLLLLTICSRRAKVLMVRTLQRYTMNPLMRHLMSLSGRLLMVLRSWPFLLGRGRRAQQARHL